MIRGYDFGDQYKISIIAFRMLSGSLLGALLHKANIALMNK